jgi:hypothetical protein
MSNRQRLKDFCFPYHYAVHADYSAIELHLLAAKHVDGGAL